MQVKVKSVKRQRGVLHDVDFILVPMFQRGELAELSEACVARRRRSVGQKTKVSVTRCLYYLLPMFQRRELAHLSEA